MVQNAPARSRVRTRTPVAVACVGAVLTVLLAVLAPPSVLVGYLGLLVCGLLGLVLHSSLRSRRSEEQTDLLRVLLAIAADKDVSELHLLLAQALHKISERRDPIYRLLALERIQAVLRECSSIADGRIEFTSTESWRLAYEQLLRSPGLQLYRSVAYVESAHYWQDGPGQQSTRLNLELQDSGAVRIERIVIIADYLWPEDDLFPVESIHSWIDEQHRHGIWLRLIRESALEAERELLCDFGIYGIRAVGMQQLDPAGRTTRFVLSFDYDELERAEQFWQRLGVYAVPYGELLDRQQ